MSNENYPVRELRGQAEIDACARLLVETFGNLDAGDIFEEEVKTAAYQISHSPDIGSMGLRAIFDGDNRIIAQYIIHSRQFCLETARLPVYCIGGVAVQPDARKGGLGSVLINDCLNLASAHNVPLLFLTGIPGYYHRFGFASVISTTRLSIRRDDIRRLSVRDDITVRTATGNDAALILDLYRCHMHPVFGSFERTLAEQRFFIDRPHTAGKSVYLIASDSDGKATGYLMLMERDGVLVQRETAARDWPTVAALLKAHEAGLPELAAESDNVESDNVESDNVESDNVESDNELTWRMPLGSRLFYAVVDHLPCRQESFHHPNGDWMARICDIDAYFQAMAPAWQERIARSPVDWHVTLDLTIDTVQKRLEIAAKEITELGPGQQSRTETVVVQLSSAAAAQLTFGYRPVAHLAMRADVDIPPEAIQLLATLYPQGPAGVAGSDYF